MQRFLVLHRDEIDGGEAEEELLLALVANLVRRIGGAILLVRGPSGIEGSLGLRAERPLCARAHRLAVAWLIVEPELRGSSGHAKSLVLEARRLADCVGRPLVALEMCADPQAGRMRLLGRHLPAAGAVFRYTPRPADFTA